MDGCPISTELASSIPLIIFRILKCLICATGCTLVILTIVQTRLRWLVHSNARVIFLVHLLCTLVANFILFLYYLFDNIRYLYPFEDPCSRVIESQLAYLPLFLYIAVDCCQVFTVLCLSLERLSATIFPVSSERIKTCSKGLVASICCVCLGLFLTYLLAYYPPSETKSYVLTVVNSNSKSHLVVFKLMEVGLQLISAILFAFVFLKNKREKVRYKTTLAHSYQMEENRKIGRILFPLVSVQLVIYIINHFGISVVSLFQESGPISIPALSLHIELVAWTPLYSIFLPIFIKKSLQNRQRRQSQMQKIHQKNVFLNFDQMVNRQLFK